MSLGRLSLARSTTTRCGVELLLRSASSTVPCRLPAVGVEVTSRGIVRGVDSPTRLTTGSALATVAQHASRAHAAIEAQTERMYGHRNTGQADATRRPAGLARELPPSERVNSLFKIVATSFAS